MKFRNKKWALGALVVGGAIGLAFTPPAERYFEIARNLDIFASLFKEVNALYVDEINPNKTIRTGIDAMLESLDPYTNFISEDEVEDFRTLNTGQYGGIGAVTRPIGKRTMVTMVFENYPAYKSGLRIGDEVVKINGVDLSRLTSEEANHIMRGQVGTPVVLTVKRTGVDKPFDLEFKREKIKISNVPYFGMVAPDVGYIKLTEFTPDAGKEVKTALISLKEKGAKFLVLDLRNNGGGLLHEAVNICNLFIPKGKKVVDTRGKVEENNITYETLNPPVDLEIPVTVLINRGSASASEIVAGTLQDYDRALILGERSYGKGLVQVPRMLSYNSQVKITIAKYYTPTGRCIQVLDYTHRREDGSVASVPDSVKKEFRTSRGRKVFDGGGIEPDLTLAVADEATVTRVIYFNGFIFDYATEYASQHPTLAEPKNFSLSDKEYSDFVSWMKTKDYTYRSPIEAELEALIAEANREKTYGELKANIDQIQGKLKELRKNELVNHKEAIKALLEREIVSRYYYERGAVENTFRNDKELKAAMEVMRNASEYKRILKI
ncbi:MAG: PDZ domain-containing protein [Cyclobacteriaceae bacterium]|nr:PDZ domain-containing protein [Cytophagales bacterium]MBX2899982.1 PDZ domain-containing protein [Cyclobacteriaceae bacterium]